MNTTDDGAANPQLDSAKPFRTRDDRKDALRYRRLRGIGAAPNGTLHLARSLVFVGTNLDDWIDAHLAGKPIAPSLSVEFDSSQWSSATPTEDDVAFVERMDRFRRDGAPFDIDTSDLRRLVALARLSVTGEDTKNLAVPETARELLVRADMLLHDADGEDEQKAHGLIHDAAAFLSDHEEIRADVRAQYARAIDDKSPGEDAVTFVEKVLGYTSELAVLPFEKDRARFVEIARRGAYTSDPGEKPTPPDRDAPDWLLHSTNPAPSLRFRYWNRRKYEWTGTDWVVRLTPAPEVHHHPDNVPSAHLDAVIDAALTHVANETPSGRGASDPSTHHDPAYNSDSRRPLMAMSNGRPDLPEGTAFAAPSAASATGVTQAAQLAHDAGES